MTPQEIFDKVVTGLATQGFEQSAGLIPRGLGECPQEICMYRGKNGRKCAAGHLIADEHYSFSLENSPVSCSEEVQKALAASGVPIEDEVVLNLILELQTAHDHGDTPGRMYTNLVGVGELFGLKMDELNAPPG